MADTKQYIVGTSDQAGKIKHKDYTEWVDSVNGKVVKSNSTSSADKANGTIITEASSLLHNSNTRIFDAIDIEWAPYKITYQGITKSLRTTNDLINNISSTYAYSCSLGNTINNSLNNDNSHSEGNHSYASGTGIIAANSQVLTYTYQSADGKLWTNYKARPVLKINKNQSPGVITSLSVSDHDITYTRTSLANDTGTKNTNTTITNSTKLNVITGIKQSANGAISYTYNILNTTHTGSLTGGTTDNQTIGSTSSAKATFITSGSLSADGVLSGTTGTISHAKSGVTSGNYGPSANTSPGSAGSFNVPYITVNDCGHITTASNKTITMPTLPTVNNSTVNFYLSNTSYNGDTSSGSFTTNQSSNGSIYFNNVALTNKQNTFRSTQTFKSDVVAAGGNFKIEYNGSIPTININGYGSISVPRITTGKLTVDDANDSGVLIVNGTGKSTGGWFVESDINYKEIIDDCKITIDEIANLPIFDYIWKLDKENKTHTGSSAQSVENILPNLVTEDDKGIKSLDYASLGTIAGVVACREICKLRDKLDKIEKLISNK